MNGKKVGIIGVAIKTDQEDKLRYIVKRYYEKADADIQSVRFMQ